jgi:polyisoprenoid-binding protein YceI
MILKLIAIAALTTAAWAQEAEFSLTPANTEINWTVGSALHTVHGTFKLKRGLLLLDPASDKAGGEIIIDAASGESGNGPRDRRMNKEVLEVQKYPEATFVADRIADGNVTFGDNSDFKLHGTLTIHGAPHEMLMPVHVKNDGGKLIGTTHLSIPYVQWGMKDPSNFLLKVDKTVEMEITATVLASTK